MLADFWRRLATIDGKAEALGRFEVFTGSYENLFSLPEEVRVVTADEIKAVAGSVFQRSNMTVGVLRSRGDAPGSGE
jgi:zinc protease